MLWKLLFFCPLQCFIFVAVFRYCFFDIRNLFVLCFLSLCDRMSKWQWSFSALDYMQKLYNKGSECDQRYRQGATLRNMKGKGNHKQQLFIVQWRLSMYTWSTPFRLCTHEFFQRRRGDRCFGAGVDCWITTWPSWISSLLAAFWTFSCASR